MCKIFMQEMIKPLERTEEDTDSEIFVVGNTHYSKNVNTPPPQTDL